MKLRPFGIVFTGEEFSNLLISEDLPKDLQAEAAAVFERTISPDKKTRVEDIISSAKNKNPDYPQTTIAWLDGIVDRTEDNTPMERNDLETVMNFEFVDVLLSREYVFSKEFAFSIGRFSIDQMARIQSELEQLTAKIRQDKVELIEFEDHHPADRKGIIEKYLPEYSRVGKTRKMLYKKIEESNSKALITYSQLLKNRSDYDDIKSLIPLEALKDLETNYNKVIANK